MIQGLGCDIVEVDRIEQSLQEHGQRFVQRMCSQSEQDNYAKRTGRAATVHLSGLWAAKEAVAKAFGTGFRGELKFTDIEITPDDLGKPCVTLHGYAKELAGESAVLVSISHTNTTAMAVATLA